mmetsp:Transcript_30685/g.35122  ORF Transcript_30685/g.35122 Transcript_30685/m.35122 type:complete len:83 (-) Transcript_30685:1195-1443(-)
MEEHRRNNYSELVDSIIRPKREEYTLEDLGPKEFSIKERKYVRRDVGLLNSRKDHLTCSHFEPASEERVNDVLPCVVFCHGN